MDLFVEKGFVENFQIEYDPDKVSAIQESIYSIFSEYTGINWFLDVSEEYILENELLFKLSDNNLSIKFNLDFDKYFDNQFVPNKQTLVLTENTKDWFPLLKEKGVLCFSYDNYEKELKDFRKKTHFEIDLSDPENIPVKWRLFSFLENNTNFIIISDPYILKDKTGQRIKDNIVPLLKENLKKDLHYKIFFIADVDINREDIDTKIGYINSQLANLKAKIYVFNIEKSIQEFHMHDRLLYSNYTITECGTGFNLNLTKPNNSMILSASIFKKCTYKRLNSHLKELAHYIKKLEKLEHASLKYKSNTRMAFKDFTEIIS